MNFSDFLESLAKDFNLVAQKTAKRIDSAAVGDDAPRLPDLAFHTWLRSQCERYQSLAGDFFDCVLNGDPEAIEASRQVLDSFRKSSLDNVACEDYDDLFDALMRLRCERDGLSPEQAERRVARYYQDKADAAMRRREMALRRADALGFAQDPQAIAEQIDSVAETQASSAPGFPGEDVEAASDAADAPVAALPLASSGIPGQERQGAQAEPEGLSEGLGAPAFSLGETLDGTGDMGQGAEQDESAEAETVSLGVRDASAQSAPAPVDSSLAAPVASAPLQKSVADVDHAVADALADVFGSEDPFSMPVGSPNLVSDAPQAADPALAGFAPSAAAAESAAAESPVVAASEPASPNPTEGAQAGASGQDDFLNSLNMAFGSESTAGLQDMTGSALDFVAPSDQSGLSDQDRSAIEGQEGFQVGASFAEADGADGSDGILGVGAVEAAALAEADPALAQEPASPATLESPESLATPATTPTTLLASEEAFDPNALDWNETLGAEGFEAAAGESAPAAADGEGDLPSLDSGVAGSAARKELEAEEAAAAEGAIDLGRAWNGPNPAGAGSGFPPAAAPAAEPEFHVLSSDLEPSEEQAHAAQNIPNMPDVAGLGLTDADVVSIDDEIGAALSFIDDRAETVETASWEIGETRRADATANLGEPAPAPIAEAANVAQESPQTMPPVAESEGRSREADSLDAPMSFDLDDLDDDLPELDSSITDSISDWGSDAEALEKTEDRPAEAPAAADPAQETERPGQSAASETAEQAQAAFEQHPAQAAGQSPVPEPADDFGADADSAAPAPAAGSGPLPKAQNFPVSADLSPEPAPSSIPETSIPTQGAAAPTASVSAAAPDSAPAAENRPEAGAGKPQTLLFSEEVFDESEWLDESEAAAGAIPAAVIPEEARAPDLEPSVGREASDLGAPDDGFVEKELLPAFTRLAQADPDKGQAAAMEIVGAFGVSDAGRIPPAKAQEALALVNEAIARIERDKQAESAAAAEAAASDSQSQSALGRERAADGQGVSDAVSDAVSVLAESPRDDIAPNLGSERAAAAPSDSVSPDRDWGRGEGAVAGGGALEPEFQPQPQPGGVASEPAEQVFNLDDFLDVEAGSFGLDGSPSAQPAAPKPETSDEASLFGSPASVFEAEPREPSGIAAPQAAPRSAQAQPASQPPQASQASKVAQAPLSPQAPETGKVPATKAKPSSGVSSKSAGHFGDPKSLGEIKSRAASFSSALDNYDYGLGAGGGIEIDLSDLTSFDEGMAQTDSQPKKTIEELDKEAYDKMVRELSPRPVEVAPAQEDPVESFYQDPEFVTKELVPAVLRLTQLPGVDGQREAWNIIRRYGVTSVMDLPPQKWQEAYTLLLNRIDELEDEQSAPPGPARSNFQASREMDALDRQFSALRAGPSAGAAAAAEFGPAAAAPVAPAPAPAAPQPAFARTVSSVADSAAFPPSAFGSGAPRAAGAPRRAAPAARASGKSETMEAILADENLSKQYYQNRIRPLVLRLTATRGGAAELKRIGARFNAKNIAGVDRRHWPELLDSIQAALAQLEAQARP